MGCDAPAAALVGRGDEPEQDLGTDIGERGEAVVGEPAVQRLGERRGGEVADLEPCLDRAVPVAVWLTARPDRYATGVLWAEDVGRSRRMMSA